LQVIDTALCNRSRLMRVSYHWCQPSVRASAQRLPASSPARIQRHVADTMHAILLTIMLCFTDNFNGPETVQSGYQRFAAAAAEQHVCSCNRATELAGVWDVSSHVHGIRSSSWRAQSIQLRCICNSNTPLYTYVMPCLTVSRCDGASVGGLCNDDRGSLP
jgi:hypothetical protein